jgi:sugar phosphate permease
METDVTSPVLPTTAADPPVAEPVGRRFGPNHRWLILGIGIASQASFAAAFQGLPTTSTAMRSAYHLSDSVLGVALGMVSLGIAVSEVVWGIWTDKFGERRILLTGLLSTGALLAVMAAAVVPHGNTVPAVGILVAGLLFVGILGGSVNGSSGRAVMAWFQDGQRGFAMSLRQTAVPVGGAVGTALLPFLAVTVSFRAVYGILAVFCFAAATAAWRWMHEPPTAPGTAKAAAGATPSPLRDIKVWRLALASGLLTIPQFAILSFLAVFLKDFKHAPSYTATVAIISIQACGAVARVWSGRWTDRHRNRRQYVRAVGTLGAVALGGSAVLTHAPTVVVVIALIIGGILANAWHGVAYTEIATMAGAQRAGTALGLENTTVFAAGFLAPIMVPLVLSFSSWTMVWAVTAIATAIAVPLAPGRPKD